jgi:methyltransferase (TIGR00027 family)
MSESLRRPSRTAVVTAVARAFCRHESPVIFDDDLAWGLAGEEGLALSGRLGTEIPGALVAAFSRWMGIRARFTEDLVAQAIARGTPQYVVLGAGLDSFAYRRRDLLDRVRVFEVDHPASQEWKRRRLRDLRIEIPDNLVFAPLDFELQTLREGLEHAGFEFQRPAFFSWIGVTMYLSLEAINATLATIAQCLTGSRVVLTYNQPHDSLDQFSLQVTSAFSAIAAELGEPFVSLFRPDDIERLLQSHGFVDIVHFGPPEARAAYLNGRADVQIAGAQRLVSATVRHSRDPGQHPSSAA